MNRVVGAAVGVIRASVFLNNYSLTITRCDQDVVIVDIRSASRRYEYSISFIGGRGSTIVDDIVRDIRGQTRLEHDRSIIIINERVSLDCPVLCLPITPHAWTVIVVDIIVQEIQRRPSWIRSPQDFYTSGISVCFVGRIVETDLISDDHRMVGGIGAREIKLPFDSVINGIGDEVVLYGDAAALKIDSYPKSAGPIIDGATNNAVFNCPSVPGRNLRIASIIPDGHTVNCYACRTIAKSTS